LRRRSFASRPLTLAFDECYGAVLQAKARRDGLDRAIVELAAEPPFAEVVGRLVCLRGVSTLTALGLTVELGDWGRFRPQSLGPFLGLTPSVDRGAPPPGRDHQDRQHPRAPASGRSGVAPAPSCLDTLWTRLIGGLPPIELCGLRPL